MLRKERKWNHINIRLKLEWAQKMEGNERKKEGKKEKRREGKWGIIANEQGVSFGDNEIL